MDNIVTAPKTDMYRFRINPEIRKQVEEVYAKNGLTFTQALNIFIQQSLNAGLIRYRYAGNSKNRVTAPWSDSPLCW